MKRLIRGRVNIGQPSYTPLAYVNQLDDITLELDIYNGNSPLDVTGQTVSLYAKRSNTTVVEQLSGLSTASTKVTGDVKNSCFAVPGITEMQLEFTDSTGKTTVSSFYINVNKSLSSEDSITAGNEIAILTEAKKMEPIRQENERGRVEAEKLRVQSETDRAAAEEIREQQELARQTCYKEIEESRKDFDGGIHKNLKLRLMRDFGDIYDRFNSANLLPYEDEYIIANDSYKGITKDLIVKGKTLQNVKPDFSNTEYYTKNSDGSINIIKTDKSVGGTLPQERVNFAKLIKPNTQYTILTSTNPDCKIIIRDKQGEELNYSLLEYINDGVPKKFTTTEGKCFIKIISNTETYPINNIKVLVLEGDYTNKPIPSYFEGIKSVNEDGENLEEISCGKNLLNDNLTVSTNVGVTYEKLSNGFKVKSDNTSPSYCKAFMRLSEKPFLGKTVRCYADVSQTSNGANIQLSYTKLDGTSVYISFTNVPAQHTFPKAIKPNSLIFGMYPNNTSTPNIVNEVIFKNIQIEEGNVNTSYEPYQEDRQFIKMKNLRCIGDICDTSDGVRRVGKATPSNTVWKKSGTTDNVGVRIYCEIPNLVRNLSTPIICNKFPHKADWSYSNVGDYVVMDENGMINIRCDSLKGIITNDVTAQKWANDNNLVVYYPLPTPTKEEGNTEELRTYDGITNIFTENSLIEPTISCKVPSNVQAVVMNLREENKTLNNDVNTLQATTEENNLMNIETNVNQEARLTMLELGVI